MATTSSVVLRTVEGDGLVFDASFPKSVGFTMDSAADPQGPSPVEALLAALGACAGMDVIGILRKKPAAPFGGPRIHGRRLSAAAEGHGVGWPSARRCDPAPRARAGRSA